MSKCNHTPEEHEAMQEEMLHAISQGDISPLVPQISNESIALTLQSLVAEIFVRAEEVELAKDSWNNFDKLVRDTLFHDKAEDSAFPEIYEAIMDIRKDHHKRIESVVFEGEAVDDMRQLFEQHGVQEPERPGKETPDASTGFYL